MTRIAKFTASAAAILAVLGSTAAQAQEKLKLAVGQRGLWEQSPPEIGQKAGIFKKHGLELEILYTQGGGETQQAVISGSVDIGTGVGFGGVMGAFSKGAPVRVIANAMIGAHDLYWYVPAESPIKTFKDAAGKTIAFSTRGSSTNIIVLGLIKHFGINATATATGSPAATFTQLMTGQIDVGWGAAPFGMKEYGEGRIRILARGSEVPSIRNQTVRVQITNADTLTKRKDTVARFVAAYREALDFMYSDAGVKSYAEFMSLPEEQVRRTREDFYPKENQNPDKISGLDEAIADAMEHKFIAQPLTKAQLDELIVLQPK
jgi:NitT/TauT family transport system substrate-binding protein